MKRLTARSLNSEVSSVTRLLIISVTVLAAGVAANAGQIDVGQFVGNTSSGLTMGLTANYVSGGGGVSCVGQLIQGNTCVAGSSTGWVERNYDATLFAGSKLSPSGTSP